MKFRIILSLQNSLKVKKKLTLNIDIEGPLLRENIKIKAVIIYFKIKACFFLFIISKAVWAVKVNFWCLFHSHNPTMWQSSMTQALTLLIFGTYHESGLWVLNTLHLYKHSMVNGQPVKCHYNFGTNLTLKVTLKMTLKIYIY